ncbi:MAG: peptidylprolyl isomerase [Actinomycetota bacterium]|nr:peptidylprolyl isomerase [Actinomycetota bacterium]
MNSLLRFRPLVAVLVALTVFAAACGGDDDAVIAGADADTVIASLADRELTAGMLDDLLPDGSNTVPSRIATVVESWLVAHALERELAERGFPITDEDRELAVAAVGERDGNDTEIQMLIDTVAISYTVGRWTDAEAANLDEPDPPNYLCSNHLLVVTEEEAQAALERFEAGEAFADLAIELSTGPSGPSGGDLGCAVEGQFVPEFEEAAYAGAAGDVVGPVETTFGWHLIEIESVGPATVDNHPDADPAVLAQIALDMQRGMVNLMILDLEGTAAANFRDQATVDPVIGTLADNSLEVIPPG